MNEFSSSSADPETQASLQRIAQMLEESDSFPQNPPKPTGGMGGGSDFNLDALVKQIEE